MRKNSLVLLVLGAVWACGSGPTEEVPHARSERIETSDGSVEFVGLRRWTLEMIRDSIETYAPGVPLGAAACGEVLRTRLGFPDAAVLRFPDGRTIVTVVEPLDSQKVLLLSEPSEKAGLIEEWSSFVTLWDTDFEAVDFAVATYLERNEWSKLPDEVDPSRVEEVWAFLAEHVAIRDFELALETLNTDADVADRIAAVNLLLNFSSEDATWHALTKALRDPDWGVRGQAVSALRVLRRFESRVVDWTQAADDLAYLLGGTTAVYHTEVVKTLVSTNVSRELAPKLLIPGAELLLAELTAEHEYVREPAHDLLVHLNGRDLGFDESPWREWIRSLQ